jgi:hypothetical protein
MEKPRLRVVLELNRPADRDECARIGRAFQRDLIAGAGIASDTVKFDATVYRNEQPCFGLVESSEVFPHDRRMNGKPLDVDALLATVAEIDPTVTAGDRAERIAADDPRIRHLRERGYMLDAVAPVGKLAIRCPNESAHSEVTSPTSTVVLLPHFNGVPCAVIKCLHSKCAEVTQKQFWSLAGYVESKDEQAYDTHLQYVFADELVNACKIIDEIVEGMLTRSALSVFYGDSNCGKTFLAIDIACAVALGIMWMGRNVEQGFVLYLATESPASVELRVQAYQKYHERTVPNLCIVESPINLHTAGGDAQLVVDLVRQLEAERGQKCILIIGDTLSRLASGANENSGEDMNVVLDRLAYMRTQCDAHMLLIHHTGKDAAKGMRGWSGVRAIVDTEIEVTEDPATGLRAAEITKQRDIPGKGDRIGFRLEVVEIGVNKWGKPVTSCVVVSADAPPKAAKGKRPSEIGGAIVELLTSRGTGMRKRDLVHHFEERYTRGAVYKEIGKMIEAKRLTEVVGVVGLVRQ